MLQEVHLSTLPIDRFFPLMGKRRSSLLKGALQQAEQQLVDRRVWNVNSTATGGGVAEMLQTILAYERGCGFDSRWAVVQGNPGFFSITKRLHNQLHGNPGDGGSLAAEERSHYEDTLRQQAEELCSRVRPQDVVLLHDPQTAGLIPALRDTGASVIWRCHIGADRQNKETTQAWTFLRPYLDDAHSFIFSRRAFAPHWLEDHQVNIIPPSIDAFAVKNQHMSPAAARAILTRIGVLQPNGGRGKPRFTRLDGANTLVQRQAKVTYNSALPTQTTPLIVQISRWDRLKDMLGVMRGFARALPKLQDAHLLLVGPDVWGVTDDPEGIEVLSECISEWNRLPAAVRDRISLVCLPMDDTEENAAMVNALQRHATIVIQKSLQEGFGLTVTEAMWKERPVVASAVGGIQEQIVHGEHGILLKDPSDLEALGNALQQLLADQLWARHLGRNARRRALSHFLAPSHIARHFELFTTVVKSREQSLGWSIATPVDRQMCSTLPAPASQGE